ncbi:hypothetical protein GCM10009589_01590 [Arthrobacter pascens]
MLEGGAVPCSDGRCPEFETGSAQEAAAIKAAPAKIVPTILFIDSPKSWTVPPRSSFVPRPGKPGGCG